MTHTRNDVSYMPLTGTCLMNSLLRKGHILPAVLTYLDSRNFSTTSNSRPTPVYRPKKMYKCTTYNTKNFNTYYFTHQKGRLCLTLFRAKNLNKNPLPTRQAFAVNISQYNYLNNTIIAFRSAQFEINYFS